MHPLLIASALAAVPAGQPLTSADQAAAFAAAGFTRANGEWKSGNCDGSEGASYSPGAIEAVADLDGDGRPEAIIVEGGAICYGVTGVQFTLVSKQADRRWTRLYQSLGIPRILASRVKGWAEIEVGVPGPCQPVIQWNGTSYVIGRRHGDGGRPCR